MTLDNTSLVNLFVNNGLFKITYLTPSIINKKELIHQKNVIIVDGEEINIKKSINYFLLQNNLIYLQALLRTNNIKNCYYYMPS